MMDKHAILHRLAHEHMDAFLEAVVAAFGLERPKDLYREASVNDLTPEVIDALYVLGESFLLKHYHTAKPSSRTRLAAAKTEEEVCEIGPSFVRCGGKLYRRNQ